MRVLLLCFALSLAAALSAQHRPITYESRFFGPVFKYDNVILSGYNFNRALAEDAEASHLLRGTIEMEVIGALFGAAGGALVPLALINPQDQFGQEFFDNRWPTFAVGAGLIGVGWYLQTVINRKRKHAVDVYNANLTDKPAGDQSLGLRFGPTRHGMGLTATF